LGKKKWLLGLKEKLTVELNKAKRGGETSGQKKNKGQQFYRGAVALAR